MAWRESPARKESEISPRGNPLRGVSQRGLWDYSDVRLHRRARSCVGGWSKGGQDGQALGRSRGGCTTKIHAKSDASGDIIAIDLTGGRSDWRRSVRRASLRNPARYRARHSAARRHLSTKATPARPIGTPRERAASLPSFPTRPTKREQASLLRTHPLQSPLFKARARIEQGVGRLKRFKRVALRCEKTARNFRSIVSFAAGRCLIKFVHTA